MEDGTRRIDPAAPITGRLATAVVQWYRDRFGRGPTEAKAYLLDGHAVVILGSVQTEVERSLVQQGELESVELLRRRIRQVFAEELRTTVSDIVGSEVVATLGDHNAVANKTVMVFVLEGAEP